MALPGSDPYKDGAPTVTSQVAKGGTLELEGTNLSAWCKAEHDNEGGGTWITEATLISVWDCALSSPSSFCNRMRDIRVIATNWDTDDECTIYNPVLYTQQTAAHIILAIAHYHAGIAEADIDVDSFDATHSFEDGNSVKRSVALVYEPAIDIIKNLLEQTYGTFIYINGQQQLASGYIGHPPYSSVDWTLTTANIITIKTFDQIRDRSFPQKIEWGYDVTSITPAEPEFGKYKREHTNWEDKLNPLTSTFEAKAVDMGAYSTGYEYGYYENLENYYKLVDEVDAIGLLMDIDEIVRPTLPNLVLNHDSDYPDSFRIHKIVIDPESMSVEVTMLKSGSWNNT